MKKYIKIVIIFIVLLLAILSFYLFTSKEKKQVNKKEFELIHLTFDNIESSHILFSNIKIFKQENEFYLTAKATNMTSNILSITPISITLIDNKNNKTNFISYIGNTIDKEEEKSVIIKTNKNLENIKKIDISVSAQVVS